MASTSCVGVWRTWMTCRGVVHEIQTRSIQTNAYIARRRITEQTTHLAERTLSDDAQQLKVARADRVFAVWSRLGDSSSYRRGSARCTLGAW